MPIIKFMWIFCLMCTLAYTMNTPIAMSLMILMMSFTVSFQFFWLKTIWLTYGVMMIISGGMMIILLYASTLSNQNLLLNPKNIFMFMILFIFFSFVVCSNNLFMYSTEETSVSPLFNSPSIWIMFLVIFYLLFSLFVVVKLCENFKGSLSEPS